MDINNPYVRYIRTINRYMCVIPVPFLVPFGWENQPAGRQLEADLRDAYKKYMNSCGIEGNPEDHPHLLVGTLADTLKTQVFLLSAMTELPNPSRPERMEDVSPAERV